MELRNFYEVYFIDGEMTQLITRMSITGCLRLQLVSKIQDILVERNVYIRELKTVMEFVRLNNTDNFSIFIYENRRPLGKQREDLMRQKPKR